MDVSGREELNAKHATWLTLPQRNWLLALLSIGYLSIAAWWVFNGGLTGDLVRLDETSTRQNRLRLDLNQADWPLLTVLPGVGETTARRIVLHREQHGPFRDVDDLLKIHGIGSKTVHRLRPYLHCGQERQKAVRN